ncbi:MAG: hypothetical protein DMF58_21080 [Acidobacteria bacterium]|nr:MAG: hypothetical protein DMF58_21080 [Acidobacteriota bacterium]
MFELKPLSKEAIPKALEKADRYRLLNEPAEAESICLDILTADPDNQTALVTLILALTDQFDRVDFNIGHAQFNELLPRLRDEYQRAYYAGVISERRAKASLHRQMHASAAYEWMTMRCCDGTRALASSCTTRIFNREKKRPRSRIWSNPFTTEATESTEVSQCSLCLSVVITASRLR